MKAGWELKNLDDICDLITCGVAAKPDYVVNGIPFLSAKNVKEGKVIWSGYNSISLETHTILTKHNKPKKGDVLYTRVGSYGEAAVIEDDVEFSVFVSLTLIKPKQNVLNNYFLKYYLNSSEVKDLAKQSISSSGVGNLNVGTVRKFPISIPPIQEQQRIVAILDEAFEQIAIARANTEKNLQNARALFESYLHSIDAEEQEFGNFVSIKTGKLDANAAVEGGAYPFFTCSRDVYRIDKFAFDCEAILLAGNNASGDFNVKHYIGKFNAYQRTYVITVNNESDASYRYLYFQLLAKLKDFKKQSVGSNTKFLKIGMIQGMKIPMPSFAEQQAIVIKLDGLLAETQHLESIYQRKLTALDALKKSLLHKAFAGEL